MTLNDFFGSNSSNPPMNWNTERVTAPNGHSYGSTYIEINYETAFFAKWRIALHGGHQSVVHYCMLNYYDWQIALVRAFEWFEFSISYVQSTGKKAYYALPNNIDKPHKRTNVAGAEGVATIAKSF